MADNEDSGHGGSFFPFVFGAISDDMRRQMAEAHEMKHLQVLDFQHTLEEAWRALNYEQLYAVARWMALAAESPDGSRNLAYNAGSLFRLAAEKSNKCLVCDKDHDKEAESLLDQPDVQPGKPETPGVVAESCATCFPNACGSPPRRPMCKRLESKGEDNGSKIDSEPNLTYEATQQLIAEHDAKLSEYGLVQNFDKGGFNCVNCGMPYRSLEDRMLKPPGIEGCSGCVHKQKWG